MKARNLCPLAPNAALLGKYGPKRIAIGAKVQRLSGVLGTEHDSPFTAFTATTAEIFPDLEGVNAEAFNVSADGSAIESHSGDKGTSTGGGIVDCAPCR